MRSTQCRGKVILSQPRISRKSVSFAFCDKSGLSFAPHMTVRLRAKFSPGGVTLLSHETNHFFPAMPIPPFVYQDPFPLGADDTGYRLLSKEGVTSTTIDGREILKVAPGALTYLAQHALRDCSFLLRTKHLQQLAGILEDPEASPNDRYVALTLLKNAEISAEGILPFCQDTGTAMVMGKKGEQVWT